MKIRNEKSIKKINYIEELPIFNGGERGIRTPDTVTRILATAIPRYQCLSADFIDSGLRPKTA